MKAPFFAALFGALLAGGIIVVLVVLGSFALTLSTMLDASIDAPARVLS
jgi:hypothetical protein